ncbi:cobalt-precorrin-7 (C(5))-methyltransferase [Cellulosilyticum sp. I15G10I2]|uniref:cobalt-precorrin-7 (C(5))-methyltransferase n=1 Tax=Cellulosilyticum sp. I15G10I2 TaxID=1892843 RepID=UPI00085BBB9D|nr:cobalt-precorrin-7 (C(5))-methyltransferase [Cellulosilyticum sp. I15G10I2]
MIYVIGIGPGDQDYLTQAGAQIINGAEIVIGAKRNLESIKDFKGLKLEMGSNLEELVIYLKANTDKKIALLASGDPLIYGIGKYLSERIPHTQLNIVPGISAVQYMFSRIPLDMNDLYITSSHGKKPDFDRVLSYPKVAMVTDHLVGPSQIAQEILRRNLKKVVIVGENLTYSNEKITPFKPEELTDEIKFDRNVVVILDEK